MAGDIEQGRMINQLMANCDGDDSSLGSIDHGNDCFADFLVLPAGNAFLLPTVIPDEIAAFLDPLGNAIHTAPMNIWLEKLTEL